ncbi:hypothetical protein [Terriglobus sp. RCC_193]|uniref:hypothetical protein n=1 Tax=Terriglobus sp. RCC_193 TaxID=3239218 RepID=UPI003526330A
MDIETLPINLPDSLSKDLADEVGTAIREQLSELISVAGFDLSLLEGVSVPTDLRQGLLAFNSGLGDEHNSGMRDTVNAKMVTTMRNGQLGAHVFFPLSSATDLCSGDSGSRQTAQYVLAHENAHCHDLLKRLEVMPADVRKYPIANPLSICLQVSWNEYAACRLSAFKMPTMVETMKEGLRQAVQGLRGVSKVAAQSFAPTQEGRQAALSIALDSSVAFLQAFSYALGHCRGLGISLNESLPENFVLLQANPNCSTALQNIANELDALWAAYGEWPGFEALNPLLEKICRFIFVSTGVGIKRHADQMSVGFVPTVGI